MKHYEKPEDMSLPQILEDIHDRICDEYCKWPSQYPLATDDEAYNRMGEEHCDKCPVRRLTQEAAVEQQDLQRSKTHRTYKMCI